MNEFGKITKIDILKDYVKDGSTMMIGGFGGVGNPPTLIDSILSFGQKNLTVICNDAGFPNIGVGKLVCHKRVKTLIASHIGSNPIAGQFMEKKEMSVEFSPQGTLAERIRAGGVGLGGILVDIGVGNEWVEKGKERIVVDGQPYLLETPLKADVALIYAKKADPFGNLIYDKTARNMNPLMAMAAKTTIAEVEEIVPLGELREEEIVTPGVFVQHIVQSRGVNWKWAWESK
ncbi:CoA transferase subunit A [Bacillus sp. FJAT-47783]|uniref:CoA transferase subunit A n=1 Tax=Bacillus sp. FJAT-47783 TaxID=2922712 RepID=UPI001FAB7868|nr:CoA transferase subunit A [Bacillus sp. FJAT-47783]